MVAVNQTLTDKIVSTLNSCRFAIQEPLSLAVARCLYGKEYGDDCVDPLITVYIPTYNRAEILMDRAVPTVLAQTYENIELLIIGDHCTDETAELVKRNTDSRIRFYNLPHRSYRYPPTAENHWLAGPVVAANKGLELARGKWIARIDDDDTWVPSHLEDSLLAAQEGDYEFVSARYEEVRNGKRRIDRGVRARDPYYTRSTKPIRGENPLIGGTSTWFFRSYIRFIRYNINCWRKKWNRVNDVDYSLRIFRAGVRMGFVPEVHAYVLPRPGEKTVGLEAYITQEKEKEEHFKFSS